MKNFTFLLFIALCTGCGTAKNYNSATENQLQSLLVKKDFFPLQTLLQDVQKKLPDDKFLYYDAYCENAFDKCLQSNNDIEKLIKKYRKNIADSIVAELLQLKCNNYIRMYQYKLAAETFRQILHSYSRLLDSAALADCKNNYQLWNAVSKVPLQQVAINNDIEIPSYLNKFSHIIIPVQCKAVVDSFVFDTGAGLSTICESYAKKMNLKVYETAIEVGNATEKKVTSKLGVADSIYIDKLLFKNVVFLILPDEALNFSKINYTIKGIIGFPVIHQMGEVSIYKDGHISIPQKPGNKTLNNLYLDELRAVVSIRTDNDTLSFFLDTGSNYTILSDKYYNKNKQLVDSTGILKKVKRGGAGGIVETEEYELKNFSFKVGDKKVLLSKISIDRNDKFKDGMLGQDVFRKFDKMTLNFKTLYIAFSNVGD